MYSTCKGPLIDVVEDDLKIPMEKKVRGLLCPQPTKSNLFVSRVAHSCACAPTPISLATLTFPPA